MNEKLNWHYPGNSLQRGVVLEAESTVSLDNLSGETVQILSKLVEVCSLLANKDEECTALIEIWLDTGRIISILSDTREFARLVVNISSLEQAYYQLPDDEDEEFDNEYDRLFNLVADALKVVLNDRSQELLDSLFTTLIIRDSDDIETEEVFDITG